MSIAQEEEEILKKTATLDIEEEKIREVLSRVHRKTEREMKGAYELLKETLHFFVQNSYSIWKTKRSLKRLFKTGQSPGADYPDNVQLQSYGRFGNRKLHSDYRNRYGENC